MEELLSKLIGVPADKIKLSFKQISSMSNMDMIEHMRKSLIELDDLIAHHNNEIKRIATLRKEGQYILEELSKRELKN